MEYYYLYVIIIFRVLFQVQSIQRSTCPIACECMNSSNYSVNVLCKSGFWTYLPPIPKYTTRLKILNGNISVLASPQNCKQYHHLQLLSLVSNNIRQISSNAFKCMPQLSVLKLKGNKLTHILPQTLSPLMKLEYLWLDNNRITPDVFKEIGNLDVNFTSFRISGNRMKLTPGVFKWLANNTKQANVDISDNTIVGSVREVIGPLHQVSILTMTSCGILSIEKNTFDGFDNLRELTLAKNKLQTITPHAFTKLSQLHTLSLTGCLHKVNMSLDWHSLPKIVNLIIDANGLTSVPPVVKSVQVLNLAQNAIQSIGPNSFKGLTQLTQINIYSCRLNQIDVETFQGLPNLSKLFLQSNSLNPRSIANLSYALANTSITSLNLADNHIEKPDNNTFANLTPNQIVRLQLQGCRMRTIGSYTFQNFKYVACGFRNSSICPWSRLTSPRGWCG